VLLTPLTAQHSAPGNLEQVISLRYGDLANLCESMQRPDYHS
jgi:hypothetical protein